MFETSPPQASASIAADPDSSEGLISSSSNSHRVRIKLQVPSDADEGSLWADAYDAGIAHIAQDSSATEHDHSAVSQPGDKYTAASSAPSSHQTPRPAYNPMQNQPQQVQQQQQPQPLPTRTHPNNFPDSDRKQLQTAEQPILQSHPETALDRESTMVHVRLPLELQSSARNSPHMQDWGLRDQPESARSYDRSDGVSQAEQQHRPMQRSSTDPFSDLLHQDISRRLSIHDRDLWSKLHKDGDL